MHAECEWNIFSDPFLAMAVSIPIGSDDDEDEDDLDEKDLNSGLRRPSSGSGRHGGTSEPDPEPE